MGIADLISSISSGIGNMLKSIVAPLALRVMAALGLSYATYTAVMPEVKEFLLAQFSGLPANALQFVQAVNLDVFMICIISALIVKTGTRALLTKAPAASP